MITFANLGEGGEGFLDQAVRTAGQSGQKTTPASQPHFPSLSCHRLSVWRNPNNQKSFVAEVVQSIPFPEWLLRDGEE